MHQAGGWQAGRTFLIDRTRLLLWLDDIAGGAEFERESRRRERLHHLLADSRKTAALRSVRLTVADSVSCDLPEGVEVRRGELRVRFSGAVDLLGRLYRLAQMAGEDFEEFSRLVESEQDAR
jgi:hypothetical protein